MASWQALLVVCILALTPRNFVSAADERILQEANAQGDVVDKTEYVRWILEWGMTDEWKIALLTKVLNVGMSENEVRAILGGGDNWCSCHGVAGCWYETLPGTGISLGVDYYNDKACHFNFTNKQGESLLEILQK